MGTPLCPSWKSSTPWKELLHHQLNEACQTLNEQISLKASSPLAMHLVTSGVDPLSRGFEWMTLLQSITSPSAKPLAQHDELKAIIHAMGNIAMVVGLADQVTQIRAIDNKDKADPSLMTQPGYSHMSQKVPPGALSSAK